MPKTRSFHLFLFIVLIGSLVLLTAALPAPAHAVGGQIAGRVTDASGAPLSGVQVSISAAQTCSTSPSTYEVLGFASSNVYTDASGGYIYSGIQSGSYIIRFSKAGYILSWYRVAGESLPSMVKITEPETTSGIDAVLSLGGKITGVVMGSDGTPLKDVNVDVRGGGSTTHATTDAEGKYTVDGLATGKYWIKFSKGDYAPVWNDGTSTGQSYLSLTAPETKSVNAVLEIGGKITGRVTDTNGTPIMDVTITVSSHAVAREGHSDSNGNFAVNGLPTGSYSVSYSKDGYAKTTYLNSTGQNSFVPVTAPNTTVGINATMKIGGKITGKITDTNGAPISGATITILDSNGYTIGAATDQSGEYIAQGIATGSYKLSFSKRGYVTVWYGGTSEDSAATISVTPPETAGNINAVMTTGGKIIGRVTDSAGNPVIGVIVSVNSEETCGSTYAISSAGPVMASTSNFPFAICTPAVTENGVTDANGHYTYSGLESGSYTVSFSKFGYATATFSQSVTVTSPDTTVGIDAVLEEGGIITGKVSDEDGAPLANVYVQLYSSSGNYIAAGTTDNTGHYYIYNLGTGNYSLKFEKNGYLSVWYGGSTDQATASSVQVTPGATIFGIDVVMGTGGEITGHVSDASGTPLSNVYVIYSSSPGFYTSGLSTDSSGNFSIKGLPIGRYKVQFSKKDYVTVWSGGSSEESSATEVDISSQKTSGAVAVVMRLGGRITGVVTDANGTPVSGVNVYAVSSSRYFMASGYTDSNGAYSVSGLPTDSYNLQFSKTGYVTWYSGPSERIAVTAPETVSGKNFSFGAGGKIIGRVTDAGGNPLSGVTVYITSVIETNAMTTTDSSGNYSLGGIPSGSYVIYFRKRGYLEQTALVAVSAPNTTSGINAILSIGGKITGRVIDSNGQPVKGAFISLTPVGTTYWTGPEQTSSGCTSTTADRFTDSNGNYSSSGLSTGLYTVRVYKQGYENGQYGGDTPSTVIVTAPNTTSGIDVTLKLEIIPPTLIITSPDDNAVINQSILQIKGTVNDNGGIKSLTINGRSMPFTWYDGSFATNINLVSGSNLITVIATDVAGNQTTVTRTVTFDRSVMPSGDLDGDGSITIADSLKALRISVGLETASSNELKNGDVAPLVDGIPSPDGKITIGDTLLILRKAVGVSSW